MERSSLSPTCSRLSTPDSEHWDACPRVPVPGRIDPAEMNYIEPNVRHELALGASQNDKAIHGHHRARG
jgi:hypothetical protein